MSILDRDPKTKDKAYIETLEKYIRKIENANSTRLIAYFGLKQYIETNSKILSELEIAPNEEAIKSLLDKLDTSEDVEENQKDIANLNKNIVDFEDKKADKMLKFADKQNDLLADLDDMREKLIESGMDMDAEDKIFLNDSEVALEKFVD